MVQPSTHGPGILILLIEAALSAVLFLISFLPPRFACGWFARVEKAFAEFARRKRLAIVVVGISAPLLRLALLPLFPVPLPFVHDEFSFLLAADTFAHGRLANPTPAMWTHFLTFHVDLQPTYGSMYFPGWGLVLAAGQVLFGHPWIAVLAANALMCAAIVWMLQAWLPPAWALLGGFIAVLHLSLFSYWINSYLGGGALLALAGALVLGALPRLIRTARFRYSLLLGLGIMILAITRPYEGLLLCLPVAAALVHWLWKGKNRPGPAVLLRRAIVPVLLVVGAVLWLGYYDYRAFGSPFILPYTLNRARYAVAPYFIWQPLHPIPSYPYDEMRRFYVLMEARGYTSQITGLLIDDFVKVLEIVLFFGGVALLSPLLMSRRVILDRRPRFLLICLLVLVAGSAIEVFFYVHYTACFTVVFYALGLQAMRHLRVWKPGGQPVGLAMVRLSLALCVAMAAFRVIAIPLNLEENNHADLETSATWIGPAHWGEPRAEVQGRLEKLPGLQLAIVRYAPNHCPVDEWVFNRADIDASKVVWAREENPEADRALLRYYNNRTAWLVEPDTVPPTVFPYTGPGPAPLASTANYVGCRPVQ